MRIIKRYIDKEFVRDRFDKKYPFELKSQLNGYYKIFGNKNPDKTFFIIWREWLGSGFFANFSQVIAYMRCADALGMIPIIDFQNFKTLYNEKEPIDGTKNAWEYYFKQVSDYSLDEIYKSKNVFFCNGELAPSSLREFQTDGSYKDFYDKRIVLQPEVEREIEKYSNFFDKKILGIHFRGKEMNYAPLHQYAPTILQMTRYTDEILEKYQIDRIFMVTEEKNYLDFFIKRYGKIVMFSDAFRVAKVNAYNLNPRKNHRYLLGREALIDATLLAKCTGILRSSSCLSSHSVAIGNHKFDYVIDNGVNFRSRYLARYSYGIKKLLPKNFGGLKDNVIKTCSKEYEK
jgi:hypothetical protein